MSFDRSGEADAASAGRGYHRADVGEGNLATKLVCFIAIGLLFSALGACTAMQTRPPAQVDASARTTTLSAIELETMLQFYARIRQFSGVTLRKEQEAQRQAFAKEKSHLARVQLALALSVPNNTYGDDARVVALLDPLVKDTGTESASLRNLALLLTTLVGDNRKLNDSHMSLRQKLKDEQKATEALEQKLEALKSLEKRPTSGDNRLLPPAKK